MTRLGEWLIQTLKGAAWAPLLVFILHVVLSKGFGAYLLYPPLDIPMHVAGGVAIAFFLLHASRTAARAGFLGMPNDVVHYLLAFSLTCIVSVWWEFAEFCSDHFLGTHAQLGLGDTLTDMLYGILGGLTFLVIVEIRQVRQDRGRRSVKQKGRGV